MDLQLTGRRAVVTGASRGIGRAVALGLAREGARVALVARDRDALEQTAEAVRELGAEALVHPADTRDDDAVRAMVAAVVAAWGGVDVLVNAAARPASSGPVPPLADLTDDACASSWRPRCWATCAVPGRWRRTWPPPAGDGSSTSAG